MCRRHFDGGAAGLGCNRDLLDCGQYREIAARQRPTIALIVLQFLIAVYGGYFGAGIGILMLSGLAMMGFSDIHSMNSLKTLFASSINGVAVLVFIAEGKVNWPIRVCHCRSDHRRLFGCRRIRRLDRNLVRRGVVAIEFVARSPGQASEVRLSRWSSSSTVSVCSVQLTHPTMICSCTS